MNYEKGYKAGVKDVAAGRGAMPPDRMHDKVAILGKKYQQGYVDGYIAREPYGWPTVQESIERDEFNEFYR